MSPDYSESESDLFNTRNKFFEPGAPIYGEGIPLCVPEIRGNEWTYIKECLDTNFVSSVGPFVDRFESSLSAYVGTRYAIATASGTAALHIALIVAGVEPNDEVLLPDLTFIAPANAIRYVGAYPIFVDVEPHYWQMDPQKLSDFLERDCVRLNDELRNRTTGRRIRAILPVDILGHPVDMDSISLLAETFGLLMIEDATESLGAHYKNHILGGASDIACFSFNGNKIITTGGGGMIVTNNESWARRAKYLTTQAKKDPIEFVHDEVGYNYRMTNIQAAMGCAQLELVDEYIAAKRRIHSIYTQVFNGINGITSMNEAGWAKSIFWMYTILLDTTRFKDNSRVLLNELMAQNIQARPLWQPLHLSPAFENYHINTKYPVAERLNWGALSLPCSVGLTENQQNRVIEAVCDWAKRY